MQNLTTAMCSLFYLYLYLFMRHLIDLSDAEISLFSLCNIVRAETVVILDLASAKNENMAQFNFGCITNSACYVGFGKGPRKSCCICYQRNCAASKGSCEEKNTSLLTLWLSDILTTRICSSYYSYFYFMQPLIFKPKQKGRCSQMYQLTSYSQSSKLSCNEF